MKLEEIAHCAKVGKERIKEIKKLNISCGFNFLCTMGHTNENLEHCLDTSDYDCFTDNLGNKPHVLCLNSEKTKEYNRKAYTLLAEAEPDFIWLDDDIRLKGHSSGFLGCFCPICLNKFSKIIGVVNLDYNKFCELTNEKNPNYLSIRKAWLKFNEDTIDSIIKVIRETCDKVDPKIELGLMTTIMEYENDGYMTWTKSMAGKNNIPVKWRPGGGYLKDWNKGEFCEKIIRVGSQTFHYLDSVNDIQSEIENFPYVNLQKSNKMNMLETCGYIGVGSTGVAYNVLLMENPGSEYNTSIENEPRFRKLLCYTPFYSALVDTFGKNHNKGVRLFQNNVNTMLSESKEGQWLTGSKNIKTELFEMGIPCAYKDPYINFMANDNFSGFTKDEILNLLSKGLILTGEAVKNLWELGYGEYIGFKVEKEINADAIEISDNHIFNDGFKHTMRDLHQAFWFETAYGMVKTNEKAQTLSYLIDYGSEEFKDNNGNRLYSMGIFENSLGGRVCVNGFYPTEFLLSYTKSTQLKNVIKYLSRGKIAYISSYHNVLLFDRSGEKTGMLLINNSFDVAENVIVNIPKNIEKICILYSDMTTKSISRLKYTDNYSIFDLGNISPLTPILLYE